MRLPSEMLCKLIRTLDVPPTKHNPCLMCLTKEPLLNPKLLVPPYHFLILPLAKLKTCSCLRWNRSGVISKISLLSGLSCPSTAKLARTQLSMQWASNLSDILFVDFLSPSLSLNSLVSHPCLSSRLPSFSIHPKNKPRLTDLKGRKGLVPLFASPPCFGFYVLDNKVGDGKHLC